MRKWEQALKAAVSATALATLIGCGGGGDPLVPSVSDAVNVSRFLFMVLTGSGSWTVSGIGSDGARYDMTITFDSDPLAFFPLLGFTGSSSTVTVTLSRNGVLIATTADISYFDPGSSEVRGSSSNDGSCSIVTSSASLPTDATPGATGALDTSTDYAGCTSGSSVEGSTVRTWSLETENLTVFFCNNKTSRDVADTVIATEAICLQVGGGGSLGTKARVTTSVPGSFSLTARN